MNKGFSKVWLWQAGLISKLRENGINVEDLENIMPQRVDGKELPKKYTRLFSEVYRKVLHHLFKYVRVGD